MTTQRKNQIPPTVNGYEWAEVVSAMQKCIRRGQEEDALYWATELDKSGYGQHVWRRLLIITSEDVGLAEPHLPAQVRALYDNWLDFKKAKKNAENMFIVHAVMILARAKKSRAVDNALVINYLEQPEWREVPDVAIDKHTLRGKRMGRGFEHFISEGSVVTNEDTSVDDPYKERAFEIFLRSEKKQPEPAKRLYRRDDGRLTTTPPTDEQAAQQVQQDLFN
jgi:replication-associated recombination protein RarA